MLINVLPLSSTVDSNSWEAVTITGTTNFRLAIKQAIREGKIEVSAGDVVTARDPIHSQDRIYFMQVEAVKKIEPVAAKTVVKLDNDETVEVPA